MTLSHGAPDEMVLGRGGPRTKAKTWAQKEAAPLLKPQSGTSAPTELH